MKGNLRRSQKNSNFATVDSTLKGVYMLGKPNINRCFKWDL